MFNFEKNKEYKEKRKIFADNINTCLISKGIHMFGNLFI